MAPLLSHHLIKIYEMQECFIVVRKNQCFVGCLCRTVWKCTGTNGGPPTMAGMGLIAPSTWCPPMRTTSVFLRPRVGTFGCSQLCLLRRDVCAFTRFDVYFHNFHNSHIYCISSACRTYLQYSEIYCASIFKTFFSIFKILLRSP